MQEIIVSIIGLITVVIIARRLVRVLQKPSSPCDTCPGCDLKKNWDANGKPKQC
ncbi:hypothetical protein [Saccharicrinis sp. FJH54]|uniref:hypothetical protein n=1 Tax=Saccharicrinis sp. FJH54 TaxID=3344665 RepID=UPI0035D43A9A